MTTPDTRRTLAWIVVLGLVLRVLWWWYARPDPVSDFEYTRRLAETVLTHHQYGYPNPAGGRVPAYPLLLAALMTLSRSVVWLSFANVLLSAALVPVVARFTTSLGFGPGVALGAAFVCAINPTFVFFAPVLATEHLFLVLLLLAFSVALDLAGGGRAAIRQAAVGGVVLGLAALARLDAIFYLPVLAGAVFWRVRRVAVVVALLVAVGATLAPWYLRNRIVIGPGAGLSTASGPNFYYAHNARAYGWHALQGTELEGLSPLEMNRRGYELGFAYLSQAGVAQIARDMLTGTARLYSPAAYPFALHWSTRQAGPTPDDFGAKPLAGLALFERLTWGYAVLIAGAGVALAFVRLAPPGAALLLYAILVMNWVGHCWIYWADPRFRVAAEVVFCVLTAFAVREILRRFR